MRLAKERKWLWLLQVLGWRFMLRLESGKLHLICSSKWSWWTRTMLLVVGWSILVVVYLIPFNYILREMGIVIYSPLSGLTGLELVILFLIPYLIVVIGLFITLWYLGAFGILWLLDCLSIPIQARYTVDIALLELRETHFGKIRHDIKVIIEKMINPLPPYGQESQLPDGDFHLIVTARRRALAAALSQQ
jgi:hypothetical protein